MASSRRSSRSSGSSIADATAPLLINDPEAGHQSSSDLVLVDDEPPQRDDFDFSSDDEVADDITTRIDRLRSSTFPPLGPPRVFLYLLCPYLLLGPFLLSTSSLALRYSIPALLLSSISALAARQLAYKLTKYVHKSDLEDVILESVFHGPIKDRARVFVRSVVRVCNMLFRLLLATIYLRAASAILVPLFPEELVIPSRVYVTLLISVISSPFVFSTTFASKPVKFVTWTSISAYVIWLGCVTFAHAKGTLAPNPQWSELGSLWHGIAPIVFTFASSWTLPLYSSLKATSPRVTLSKPTRRYSFRSLSLFSTALAFVFVLPLCFFSAHPNAPDSPNHPPHALIAVANALALTLTIPLLLISATPLPYSSNDHQSIKVPLSKTVLFMLTVALSFLPSYIMSYISNVVLVLAVAGTYILPAGLHIVAYHFKSPLSIVLPGPTAAGADSETDELLLRKERMLQRRRLNKRLTWDIIAWLLILVFGLGGILAVGARVMSIW